MSAGIILNGNSDWIVAGWVASNVAEQLKGHLDEKFSRTVGERLDAMDLYPGSLADFTSASTEEMLALYTAAIRVRKIAEERGPEGWNQPEFFSGYLARVDDLISLLTQDARVSGEQV